MKPKVIVLTTGGTISQRSKADGVAAAGFDPQDLAAELGLSDVELEFRKVFQKGSKDIVPDDWADLAEAAAKALGEGVAGVVVLHGTDTLHYTASALSYMLKDMGAPVVITGSMIPGGDKGSDSQPNLRDAIRVAAFADLAEVCVVFSADRQRSKSVIIRGNRARKIHSHMIDAFDSINAPFLGSVESDTVKITATDIRRRSGSKPRLETALDQNVMLIKLTPALTPAMLARQLEGLSGAVLEGTGIGHTQMGHEDVIRRFAKPVLMTTQTVYGGEKLGMYDTDKRLLEIPNIIPGADLGSEPALVKLMWALGQGGDIRAIMRRSVAGEIGGPDAGQPSQKNRT